MQNTKTYTVDEAKSVLEKYCIYQNRCHQEVLDKLYKMNMITEAQEVILLHLIQHNYLNEERYAKSFARGKFYQKKWGKIKITNQLKFKRISATNIKTALKEIDEGDYITTLSSLAHKKIEQVKGATNFEKRKKTIYFLQSKGYEFSLILSVLDKLV
jgi:regulatory protein